MDTLSTTPSAASDAEKPKQYIRTFHGDIETVKKGGAPDLTPLRTPASTAISAPIPVPAPIPAPIPPRPSEASSEGGSPVIVPEIPRINPPETYSNDFSERVKETQSSTATVLAAEQDSGPHLVEVQSQKISRSGILYTTAGAILLVAGGVGAYIAYSRYLSTSTPIILAPVATAPIFVDERKEISGTGTALLQAVEQSVTSSLASGSVRLLYLANATDSTGSPQAITNSVFSALQLPAPGALLRNINGAGSMTGVVDIGGSQSPFFILSVTSYSQTFAGMLQWELHMPRDLEKLFPAYAVPVSSVPTATTTVATTMVKTIAKVVVKVATASTSSPQATTPAAPVFVAAFYDATIANHDVRVYRDTAGREVLLYGYWNQTTLIIARNAAAFAEIIGRLATSRVP